MATSVMPPHVSADAIQDNAVKRGFSKRGEMFSCDNLCALANDLMSGRADGKVEDGELIRNVRLLWEEFSFGSLFLVPYDTDFNQEPCLRKGHKAHWALIIGNKLIINQGPISTQNTSWQDSTYFHPEHVLRIPCWYDIDNLTRDNKQLISGMILLDPDRDRSNHSAVSCPSPEEASKVDLAASLDGVKLVARQSKSLRLFLFDPDQGRRYSSVKATSNLQS